MIDIESLHRNYDASSEWLSKKENRDEKNHTLFGVTLTSSLGPSVLSACGMRSAYVTIPAQSTIFQKTIVFLLVQGKVARFVRKENQYIGYAFSWVNAREIFEW
jgi:hypothetical protein